MSRPRRPSDPATWPQPCTRCGEHHQLVVTWPDGRICGYCYQQAKRTTGRCRCGHVGVLPGRIDAEPACRSCSGVRLNVDCLGCGREDEVHSAGLCWSCTLGQTVDQLLTDPATGVIAPPLVSTAQALKSMKRANSGLTWVRQQHVAEFLRRLATAATISHDAVDALPASRTREYVRGLLVEHGALPRRDELLARFREWSTSALDRVDDPEHRDIMTRYIRWHHLRRMNGMDDDVSRGTFLRSKQTVTVAIDLLNWLSGHGNTLSDLEQAHLDAWRAQGPTTREIANRFLAWAIKAHLVRADLTLTPHRRGTSPTLSSGQQAEAVQRVVHTMELSARDRAAAIFVIVFGQQIEAVTQLTWGDVQITDDLVIVRFGRTDITLPAPLDEPLRHLAAEPGNGQTAAHPHSDWVFRGYSPGRPITAAHLRGRLRQVFSTRAARLGTLHELTKLAPVAVIADTLGYASATIERHATASAATYAQYVATRRTTRPALSKEQR